MLKVTRTQIPLVPAFALTAHASQGKTLPPGHIRRLSSSLPHRQEQNASRGHVQPKASAPACSSSGQPSCWT